MSKETWRESQKSVKLLFCFFSQRQKTHAQGRPHSPLINYGEIGERLLAQRFQGTFLGGQSLITIGRWVSKDDHCPITAYIGYNTIPNFSALKLVWCRHLLRLANSNTLVFDSQLPAEAHTTVKKNSMSDILIL